MTPQELLEARVQVKHRRERLLEHPRTSLGRQDSQYDDHSRDHHVRPRDICNPLKPQWEGATSARATAHQPDPVRADRRQEGDDPFRQAIDQGEREGEALSSCEVVELNILLDLHAHRAKIEEGHPLRHCLTRITSGKELNAIKILTHTQTANRERKHFACNRRHAP